MTENFASHAEARVALARRALAAQPQSTVLLLQLADAVAEMGDDDEFALLFRRAFVLQPSSGLLLGLLSGAAGADAAHKVRHRAQALLARGVGYSPVIAALAIGEALLGNREKTRRLVDYERFFRCAALPAPDGFAADTYRGSLAAEIKSKLKYFERQKGKTGNGWYHMHIERSPLPATRAFMASAHRAVARYIAALPAEADHPFVASRPAEFAIIGWAVVSDSDGYFEPHIHPQAWVSGVYYVTEPKIARTPARGWLRVGAPAKYGVADAWPERMVPPTAGQLVLMPGYFFHETQPLGVAQERISIAFDVVPAELAAADSIDY